MRGEWQVSWSAELFKHLSNFQTITEEPKMMSFYHPTQKKNFSCFLPFPALQICSADKRKPVAPSSSGCCMVHRFLAWLLKFFVWLGRDLQKRPLQSQTL